MASTLLLLSFLTTLTTAQSIRDYGTSGGSGPTGGMGDADRPILHPQAFITDGLVTDGTTNASTRQLTPGPPPILRTDNATDPSNTTTNGTFTDPGNTGCNTVPRTEILGFGMAWTDSTVDVFDALEPALRDRVLAELFGQDGNNMGFMRHTIGSSDLSQFQYSYNDNGLSFNDGEPDPDLSNFNLGPYGRRMAEYLAMMGEHKGDVTLLGAPWSMPGWMKSNALFIAPADTGNHYYGNNSLNPHYIPSVVTYFAKYIDAFRDEYGVVVNAISPQNEPLNPAGGTTSMYMDALDQAALLQEGLADEMRKRGVKIVGYDHNTDVPNFPYRIMQRDTDLLDAVGWHCYQGPVAVYDVLQDFSYTFPGVPQFMTECANTRVVVGEANFWVAQNFIPSVNNGSSGGIYWVMGTDPDFGPRSPYGGCATCYPMIIVNSSTVYTKTHDYYMVGHFSRFIRRGAVNHKVVTPQVGASMDYGAQFWTTASQNPDGSWVVVFLNGFPRDNQDVTLQFSATNLTWRGTIPASTVVTWLLPADTRLSNLTTATTAPPSHTVASNITFHSPSVAPRFHPSNASMPMFGGILATACPPAPPPATTSENMDVRDIKLPVPNIYRVVNVTTKPAWDVCLNGAEETVAPLAHGRMHRRRLH
ncbi:glycoside hydrolase family 30 protein, partial [Teratosphaeria destructans]